MITSPGVCSEQELLGAMKLRNSTEKCHAQAVVSASEEWGTTIRVEVFDTFSITGITNEAATHYTVEPTQFELKFLMHFRSQALPMKQQRIIQ